MEMIDLKTLWIQRKESYPGEYAPECLLAVDQYTDDSNPEYWEDESKKQLDACGNDVENFAIITVRIPREEVNKRLRPGGTVNCTVVPE